MTNSTRHFITLLAALLLGIVSVSGAYGSTPVKEMSNTIEKLCPALRAAYTADPLSLTLAEQDVFFRCRELKLAAAQTFSDLTAEQLNGLGNMTSDETSTMGTTTVELSGAQNIAIVSRLSVLRGKTVTAVAANHSPGLWREADTARQSNSFTKTVVNLPLNSAGENVETFMNEAIDGYKGGFSQMSDYGKLGIFLNGSFSKGSKDTTSQEPGFNFNSWSLVSGLDYRLTDKLVLGGALSYAVTKSSVDNSGGDVDLDGYGASFYGTYYVGEFYLDVLAGVGKKQYDTRRNVAYSVGSTIVRQVFDGSTDATDVNISLGTGYNLVFNGFAVTPFAQVAYLDSKIDGYTESLQGNNTSSGFGLALKVDEQKIKSLASTLGLQFARTINTSHGVLTPYLRVDWQHEFENDARNITAHFATVNSAYDTLNTITIQTNPPDRDFFNFGVGLSALLPGGFQCFLEYSTVFDYDNITLHRVVAGARWEF